MASCDTVRQFLVDYADGRLGGTLKAEVAAHLEACAPCRQEASSLKATWQMLEAYPSIEPSEGFMMGLRHKVHGLRSRLFRIVAPLAAAAAVLLIVYAVTRDGGAEPDLASPSAVAALGDADQALLGDYADEDLRGVVENREFLESLETLGQLGPSLIDAEEGK